MSAAHIGLVVAWVGCFLGVVALSVAEVAIIRVRRSRVAIAAEEGDARSRRLLALIDDLPVVMNTVLLLVLLLQLTIASIGGFLAQQWFGNLGVTVATVATTVVLFVYAEAIPKTVAIHAPHQMALRVTPAMTMLVAVLGRGVRLLVWFAGKQTPGPTASLSAFSEEELRALARESAEAGVIAEDDAELVDRSFEFGDRKVVDVMVPRHDIAFVDAGQSLVEVLAVAVAVGHRRLPICRDGLDDIIGMARFRDIAMAARSEPQAPVASVAIRPAAVCDLELPISELLDRMQAAGRWLAIATDPDRPDPRSRHRRGPGGGTGGGDCRGRPRSGRLMARLIGA